MDMPLIFYVATVLEVPLWLPMILWPEHPWTRRVAASPWALVPLAGVYALLLLAHLPAAVASLATFSFGAIGVFLATPFGTTLNWLHLAASDLVVGRWIYKETRDRQIDLRIVGAILCVCWVFAPLGLICYLGMRQLVKGRQRLET